MWSSSSRQNSGPRRPDTRWLPVAAAILSTALPGARAEDAPDPELRERLREAMHASTSFPDRFDAQVWLTDMALRLGNQVRDPQERVHILKQAHWEASRVALPPEMILAVIDIESAFDPYAVSVAGAQGLMQVMPFWLDEIGRPNDRLVDIDTNLRMGCTILKYYYDMEKGDWIRALGRYNGSLGSRRYPEKVLERLRSRWFRQ
ncbi:MAG: lytic transglycosylase domain-containing protein [Chromatiales bacterium]|nr:MAG: lytic transglycosylase domain-containing protein [Chromatiales bacterium]